VVTRAEARGLGLEEGSRVWLRPHRGASTVPLMKAVTGV
jgi:hypothetical protein